MNKKINTSEVQPNGTAGEFQSDSKSELLKTNQKKELVTITGTLTSRIETRYPCTNQMYHYGFFKSPNLVDREWEFPVIFKDSQDKYYKPNLVKGSELKLVGF
jgi:hypothetical protein